jgi:hypothetical protein
MGNPMSDGVDKTTVEPGNNFSPGVWTCGISTWVIDDGLYSPDILEDSLIRWNFGKNETFLPIIESSWDTPNCRLNSQLTHIGTEGSNGTDFCKINVESNTKSVLLVVVKDIGPAGGKIESIVWDENSLSVVVNDSLRIQFEHSPTSYEILEADGLYDSPMCVVSFDIHEGKNDLKFKAVHGFAPASFLQYMPDENPAHVQMSVQEGFDNAVKQWEQNIPAKFFCPDKNLEKAWFASCFHILSAMELGLPRIGAVNYPVFWIRDCIIVLRALDLIGRHDLAKLGNEYLCPLFWGGGFGAEADAPGEGIWAIVNHAVMTNDDQWLKDVFPFIKKRVEFIVDMIKTDKPIRNVAENRMPTNVNSPTVNVTCLASENGYIKGRMDWHTPDFYINTWAMVGLNNAIKVAQKLNHNDFVSEWTHESEALKNSIEKFLIPKLLENNQPRDLVVAPYPTNTFLDNKTLKENFIFKYKRLRLNDDGTRKPEELWTYFEVAQIHNAILNGMVDEAWVNLDGMIESSNWDMCAYIEGRPGQNEFLNFKTGDNRRGWLNSENALGGNMPHNWTSAEMVNLIRDIFVYEANGEIVLGKGVPRSWLKPGKTFGVENMPTNFGLVTYSAKVLNDGNIELEYDGPTNYRRAF